MSENEGDSKKAEVPKDHWLSGLVKGEPVPEKIIPEKQTSKGTKPTPHCPTGPGQGKTEPVKRIGSSKKETKKASAPGSAADIKAPEATPAKRAAADIKAPEAIPAKRAAADKAPEEVAVQTKKAETEKKAAKEKTVVVSLREAKAAHRAEQNPSPPRRVRRNRASSKTVDPSTRVVILKPSEVKERAVLYKAMATMLDSGIGIVGVFEFLAEQAQSRGLSEACRRTAQNLAAGHPLHIIAQAERRLFTVSASKMLEVGLKTGKLVRIIERISEDENARWQMRQRLVSQLRYPVCLAFLALAAAVLVPPLVLAGILEEVVALSDEPPALTMALLKFSSFLSSPVVWGIGLCCVGFLIFVLTRTGIKERLTWLEELAWRLPAIGSLLQVTSSIRFLQIFAMNYEVGLPAPMALRLAAQSSGSRFVAEKGEGMKERLIAGETLYAAIEQADFLPQLACEAVKVGDEIGRIPVMMRKAAEILSAELEYRIEAFLTVLEPLLLSVLGVGVGVFALGCLLPILKLAETL